MRLAIERLHAKEEAFYQQPRVQELFDEIYGFFMNSNAWPERLKFRNAHSTEDLELFQELERRGVFYDDDTSCYEIRLMVLRKRIVKSWNAEKVHFDMIDG